MARRIPDCYEVLVVPRTASHKGDHGRPWKTPGHPSTSPLRPRTCCASWSGPRGSLVRSTGLTRAEIRRFVDLDVLLVKRRYVEATLMRRLRRARRLRRDLGLSLDEVAIILRLLDRIEALQQAQAQRQRAYQCPRPARGRPAG